jgi:hypothetical protein
MKHPIFIVLCCLREEFTDALANSTDFPHAALMI